MGGARARRGEVEPHTKAALWSQADPSQGDGRRGTKQQVSDAVRKERVCDEIGAGGEPADLLIAITPGVERFEYFRHLERDHVRAGAQRG